MLTVQQPLMTLSLPPQPYPGEHLEDEPTEAGPQRAEVEDMNEVVTRHLPLVRAIAARIQLNLPRCVEQDDLIQAGAIGLMDAIRKYDPEKQIPFAAYAKHRIRGAILDSLRHDDTASRDVRRSQKQIESATTVLSRKLERKPTETELAVELKMGVDVLRKKMVEIQDLSTVSLSTRPEKHNDLPLAEPKVEAETHPDFIFARKEQGKIVNDALKTLPSRYQRLIQLYYVKELTMKEISRELQVNESRVSQMHTIALGKINAAMKLNSINSSQAW